MQGQHDSGGLELPPLTACAIHRLPGCRVVSAKSQRGWSVLGASNGTGAALSTGSMWSLRPRPGRSMDRTWKILQHAYWDRETYGYCVHSTHRSIRRYVLCPPYDTSLTPLTGCFTLTHPLIHDFQDPPLLTPPLSALPSPRVILW
jgi:hypothetical protein